MSDKLKLFELLDFVIRKVANWHLRDPSINTKIMNDIVKVEVNISPSSFLSSINVSPNVNMIELLRDMLDILIFLKERCTIRGFVVEAISDDGKLCIDYFNEECSIKVIIISEIFIISLPANMRREYVEELQSFLIKLTSLCLVKWLGWKILSRTILGRLEEFRVHFNIEQGEQQYHEGMNIYEIPYVFKTFFEVNLTIDKGNINEIINTIYNLLQAVNALKEMMPLNIYSVDELLSKTFWSSLHNLIERLKSNNLTFEEDEEQT